MKGAGYVGGLNIETVAKIRLLIKNPQFLPNLADILAILPTHELVIFTKFFLQQSLFYLLVIAKEK